MEGEKREKNWMHEPHASDTAAFNVYNTDPGRLSAMRKKLRSEIEKTFGIQSKPDSITGIQDASDHYMHESQIKE